MIHVSYQLMCTLYLLVKDERLSLGSKQQLGQIEQQLEGAKREATQERERAESEAARHDAELLALQRQVGATAQRHFVFPMCACLPAVSYAPHLCTLRYTRCGCPDVLPVRLCLFWRLRYFCPYLRVLGVCDGADTR